MGFSKTHLFNIVLAGLCEAENLKVAISFLETATRGSNRDVKPNVVR